MTYTDAQLALNRIRLEALVLRHGLGHPAVLRQSQKVDRLLNGLARLEKTAASVRLV